MLKKGLIHFVTTFKVINAKKGLQHCLKVFKTEKGLHHFLMTLKDFKTEKALHDFLTTHKFLVLKKDTITFLRLLKVLIFKSDSITFLWLLKVFQNSYSVECWWETATEGHLSYHLFINKLDLLWMPNFVALGMYFLFGTKFSWNEGIDICFHVEYVLLSRNFDFLDGYLVVTARYLVLTVTACYLVITTRYRSLLLFPLFVCTHLTWWKKFIFNNTPNIYSAICCGKKTVSITWHNATVKWKG